MPRVLGDNGELDLTPDGLEEEDSGINMWRMEHYYSYNPCGPFSKRCLVKYSSAIYKHLKIACVEIFIKYILIFYGQNSFIFLSLIS